MAGRGLLQGAELWACMLRPTQTLYRKPFPFGSAYGPKGLSKGLLGGLRLKMYRVVR